MSEEETRKAPAAVAGSDSQTSTYIGQAVEFDCPECGEHLWVYLPANGPTQVLRARDIPPESDDDDTGDAGTE